MANNRTTQELLIDHFKIAFDYRYVLKAMKVASELPDEVLAVIDPGSRSSDGTARGFKDIQKMIDDRLADMEISAKATLVKGNYVTADGRTDEDLRQIRIDPLPEYLLQEKREVSRLIKEAADYGCPNIKKERNARSKSYYRELVVLKRQVVLSEKFKQDLQSIRETQCALAAQYAEMMLKLMCNGWSVFERLLQIAEEGTGGLLKIGEPQPWYPMGEGSNRS